MLAVLELKVELLGEEGRKDLHLGFRVGLAKAASTAAMEGHPAVDMALFATRRLTQRVIDVEALRQELCRSLPLLRVVSHCLEADSEGVTSLERILAQLQVLGRRIVVSESYRIPEAQRLIHQHPSEVKLLHGIDRHDFV